jgi:hypothetical protein
MYLNLLLEAMPSTPASVTSQNITRGMAALTTLAGDNKYVEKGKI